MDRWRFRRRTHENRGPSRWPMDGYAEAVGLLGGCLSVGDFREISDFRFDIRPGNPQLAHLIEEGRALESQPFGCSSRASQHPLGFTQGAHDLVAVGLRQGTRLSLDF